jgi:hypothetical protein
MGSVTWWRRMRVVTALLVQLLVLGAAMEVLTSGLAIPVAAAAGAAVNAGSSLFDALPTTMAASSLPQASVMLAAKDLMNTAMHALPAEPLSVQPMTAQPGLTQPAPLPTTTTPTKTAAPPATVP